MCSCTHHYNDSFIGKIEPIIRIVLTILLKYTKFRNKKDHHCHKNNYIQNKNYVDFELFRHILNCKNNLKKNHHIKALTSSHGKQYQAREQCKYIMVNL